MAAAAVHSMHKHSDPETLDIHTLHAKLESAKREQDAARLRRQKRESVRNGGYFPHNAARSLLATTTTATATTERDAATESRRGSGAGLRRQDVVTSTTEPKNKFVAIGGRDDWNWEQPQLRCNANPKSVHAAMSMGMSEVEASRDTIAWRNSLVMQPQESSDLHQDLSPPRINGLQTKIIPIKSGSQVEYQRIGLGIAREPTSKDPSASAVAAAVVTKQQHDLDQIDMTRLVIRPDGQRQSNHHFSNNHPERPSLQSHNNRPNWTQSSECGDDYRRRRKAEKIAAVAGALQSVLLEDAAAAKIELESGSSRRLSDQKQQQQTTGSLVADAVAIIKEEQRSRRSSALKTIFRRGC